MAKLKAEGKWEDYVNLPNMKQYDKDTVEAVVRKLTTIANQRLRSLERNNLQDTPSYRNIAKEYKDAKFPTKLSSMSRNELLKQYSRLNWFLDNKTSTVKGAKQVVADFNKRLGTKLTADQEQTFWEVYNKLKEMAELTTELYYLDSNQIMQQTAETVKDSKMSVDDMLDTMKTKVENAYREKMGQYVTDEETLKRFS